MSVFTRQNAMSMKFTKDSWAILDAVEQSIKDKIEKYGTPLKEWGINIYRGVLTGCNDAFIIDGAKRAELIAADPKSDEIIRPILRGRDIKRYGYDFADKWLIALLPSRKYDINDFPAVKAWLESFGKKLDQSGSKYIDEQGQEQKCRKKTNNKWYETQDSIAYWNDFSKQKIAYREISDEMGACLIDDEYFLNNKCYIITGNIDLKPLVAYLNSNLFTQIVLQMVNTTGGKGADFIDKLHAPNLTANQVNKLGTLVEQIQVCQSNVLDEQIDQIIYEAFNLSLDEIDFLNKRKRSQ